MVAPASAVRPRVDNVGLVGIDHRLDVVAQSKFGDCRTKAGIHRGLGDTPQLSEVLAGSVASGP
jgi:hypothetical protein